jgi:hypothetical protein
MKWLMSCLGLFIKGKKIMCTADVTQHVRWFTVKKVV